MQSRQLQAGSTRVPREPASQVLFQRRADYVPITMLSRIAISAMSCGPAWHGMHVEVGASDKWYGETLIADGHFVAINLSAHPVHLEVRFDGSGGWEPVSWRPGALWIQQAGSAFSLRHSALVRWAAAVVDRSFLNIVLGHRCAFGAGGNIIDKQLEYLFRALVEVAGDPSSDPHVVHALTHAFARTLALRQGKPEHGAQPLGPSLIARWVDDNLDKHFSVSDLARAAGLSTAQLSREFKRVTGLAPWEYVISRRLERAWRLLMSGESVATVAVQCGFYDQAHLSKLFRKRFGVSPLSATNRR